VCSSDLLFISDPYRFINDPYRFISDSYRFISDSYRSFSDSYRFRCDLSPGRQGKPAVHDQHLAADHAGGRGA
jgi:hypothetical protein